jgi:hypothetical protein
MSQEFRPTAAYSEALALNTAAVTAGHFEAAYHFLMAALHCAEATKDKGRLAEVAERARAQRDAVDARLPTHRLATQRAHSGHSIYEMAAIEAEAVIKRLESERRIAQHKPLR